MMRLQAWFCPANYAIDGLLHWHLLGVSLTQARSALSQPLMPVVRPYSSCNAIWRHTGNVCNFHTIRQHMGNTQKITVTW